MLTGLCTCQVDPQRNLLFVRGSVPGPLGTWVRVRDSIRRARDSRRFPVMAQRPLPTFVGELPGEVLTAKWDRPDPNRLGQDLDAGDKNPLKASKASAGGKKGGGKK